MPITPTPQLIADEIGRRIIRGELIPGERLRQEYVAAEFNVSHVPVREAMLKLAARGLVVTQHNKGVQVAPLDPMAHRELKLMRLALEPLTLLHSVPHLTPAQIRKADDLRRACDQAENIYEWEELNRAFHMQIYAACDMPRLLETVENMQNLAARYILIHYRNRWRPRVDNDHHGIIAAIHHKDARTASLILERHLQR